MSNALLKAIKNAVLDYEPVERAPTGSLSWDLAMGGGLPLGRIIELGGTFGSGKTTLGLVASGTLSKHSPVIYYDFEGKVDITWAGYFGACVGENFYLTRPDTAEEGLNEILDILEDNDRYGVKLIVIDSLGSLSPSAAPKKDKKKDNDEDEDDKQIANEFQNVAMARKARMFTPFFEQARLAVANSGASLLCINQLRANLSGYGRPTYMPGGWQKDHSMSLVIRLKTPERVESAKKLVGRDHKGEVERNQTAFGLEKFTIPIQYKPAVQVDRSMEVYLLGLEQGLILSESGKKPDGKTAAFYGDTRLGVGRGNCANYLDAHLDVREAIEHRLREVV